MQKEESVQGEQLAVPFKDDARRKYGDFSTKIGSSYVAHRLNPSSTPVLVRCHGLREIDHADCTPIAVRTGPRGRRHRDAGVRGTERLLSISTGTPRRQSRLRGRLPGRVQPG